MSNYDQYIETINVRKATTLREALDWDFWIVRAIRATAICNTAKIMKQKCQAAKKVID